MAAGERLFSAVCGLTSASRQQRRLTGPSSLTSPIVMPDGLYRCHDCGSELRPDEAMAPAADARRRCDECWYRLTFPEQAAEEQREEGAS
jgi:DNA-directed RNA polymerase subunit RPC12/RpoP